MKPHQRVVKKSSEDGLSVAANALASFIYVLQGVLVLSALCIMSGVFLPYLFKDDSSSRLPARSIVTVEIPTVPPFPISILLIDRNTIVTLNHTLASYKRHGLHLLVNETLLFIQEIQNYPAEGLRRLAQDYPFITRVVGNFRNTWVHGAIGELVHAARSPFLLLLEKDFELVENRDIAEERLREAMELLRNGDATVVRMKSRRSPGVPEFARMDWQYKEEQMLSEWPASDLACQLIYWMNDSQALSLWARHNISIRHCAHNKDYWCAPARWCHWTNQAMFFSREWFLRTLQPVCERLAITDRGSLYQNHNALEIHCRWEPAGPWLVNPRHMTALGKGLFRHNDIERYPALYAGDDGDARQ